MAFSTAQHKVAILKTPGRKAPRKNPIPVQKGRKAQELSEVQCLEVRWTGRSLWNRGTEAQLNSSFSPSTPNTSPLSRELEVEMMCSWRQWAQPGEC